MRATRISTLVAAAIVLTAAPARSQNATIDSRWIAYLGCWESVGLKQSTICVLPVGESAVDLVTVDSGAVIAAERIVAGTRVATTQGECAGWQMAEWSAVSDRLYLQSEETCARLGTRAGNGLIALARDGSLLYIQGGSVGVKTGVQAQRYREGTSRELPSEVSDALAAIRPELTTRARARAMAMAPLTIEDVTEASRHLENDVVEAWLVERGGSIILDADRLVLLANAGVPSSTTDLLVALAYPNVFALNGRHRQTRVIDDYVPIIPPATLGMCDVDYRFGYGSTYCNGFGGYGAYGYGGYPFGWYPGYPYVIVYTGPGGGGGGGGGNASRAHGRVLNGRGYREGQGSDVPSNPSSGSSTGSTSTRTSTPSSSSSSGEQRTAKPRP